MTYNVFSGTLNPTHFTSLCVCLGLALCVFFSVFRLDHFVFVFLDFLLIGLLSSVLSEEIGREERLRNDPFCVSCGTYKTVNHSISHSTDSIGC